MPKAQMRLTAQRSLCSVAQVSTSSTISALKLQPRSNGGYSGMLWSGGWGGTAGGVWVEFGRLFPASLDCLN